MLSNRFRTIKVYPKDLPSGPRHAETPSVAAALPSSSKSVLGPEGLLAMLPTELSHSLFARPRPLSLAAESSESRSLIFFGPRSGAGQLNHLHDGAHG
jgi:hypothetical protein